MTATRRLSIQRLPRAGGTTAFLALAGLCALALAAVAILPRSQGTSDMGESSGGHAPRTPFTAGASGPAIYVVRSETERELVSAFVAQINRSRVEQARLKVDDEVLVSARGTDQWTDAYLAFVSTWQAGRGQTLTVADLRSHRMDSD